MVPAPSAPKAEVKLPAKLALALAARLLSSTVRLGDVPVVAMTRDGERLEVHALYGDGSRSLIVRLHFNVTPPAQLATGTWAGPDVKGEVRQRSITFLGGQSGAPSIGGRFDLIGPDDRPLYRVTIPLQELKHPL